MKVLKTIIAVAMTLVMVVGVFAAQRVAQTTPDKTSGRWEGSLLFYKKIVDGADSTFTLNSDSVSIGVSDTVYSDIYYARAMQSIQLNIRCAGTLRLQVKVLCGNSGDDFTAISMPDSMMVTFEWLKMGTGVAGNLVSTSADSITSEGLSTPIRLWCSECELFQFLFITSHNQSGNAGLSGWLKQKEVY